MKKKTLLFLPLVALLAACDSGNAGFDTTVVAPKEAVKITDEKETEENGEIFSDEIISLVEQDFAVSGSVSLKGSVEMKQDSVNTNVNVNLSTAFTVGVYFSKSAKYEGISIPSISATLEDFTVNSTVKISAMGHSQTISVNIPKINLGLFFDAPTMKAYLDLSDPSIKSALKPVFGSNVDDATFELMYTSMLGDGHVYIDIANIIAMFTQQSKAFKTVEVTPADQARMVVNEIFNELGGTYYYLEESGRAGFVVNVDEKLINESSEEITIPEGIAFNLGLLVEGTIAEEEITFDKLNLRIKLNVNGEDMPKIYLENTLDLNVEYEDVDKYWTLDTEDYAKEFDITVLGV